MSSFTVKCASCGFERGEHHYNGACYGTCGDFVSLGYEYDNVQRELDRTPNHVDRWHVLMDRAEELRRRWRGE